MSSKKNIPTAYLVVFRVLCLDEELVTGVDQFDHFPCHEDLNNLVAPEIEEYVNFKISNGELPERYYEIKFNIYKLVGFDSCHTSIAESSYDNIYNDVIMNNIKDTSYELDHCEEVCNA